MKFFNTALFFAILAISSTANAAREESKLINVLHVNKAGDVSVAVHSPAASAHPTCYWSVLSVGNLSNEATKALYSMALSAKVADRPVTIDFTGCEVDGITFP